MSELAVVDISRDASGTKASVAGEIDASNASLVRSRLEAALNPPRLTVDLRAVEYLDSAGVHALFALAESAATRGTDVAVVLPADAPVRRVLDIAGVREVIRVQPDED
jgi:anti-anti-sigma factor